MENQKKYLRNYGDDKFDLGDINGTKISDYMKTFKYNIKAAINNNLKLVFILKSKISI